MAVPGKTLVEIFENRVAKTPDLPALRGKVDGQWKVTTFRDYGVQAREVANGLLSLGVQKGQSVALLSNNRPEWHIADAGIMLTGGVSVPVYVTNSPPQVSYVVGHCEAQVVIVEDQDQLDKVLKTRKEMPKLKKVVVMTGEGSDGDDFVMSWDELRRVGREHIRSNGKDLDERIKAVEPEDMATIVYTSGTTGPPKGAMISHGGFAWTLESISHPLPFQDGADRVVCYLPLSHIFERLTSMWGGVYFAMDVWFAPSVAELVPTLKDCRPTFFIGVPRVYEKFHMGVQAQIANHPKKDVIEKALHAGMEVEQAKQDGKPIALGLKLKHAVLDKLALSKLREALGLEQSRFAVSGAAPLAPEVQMFVRALGLDLVEGYGLTETNAPISVNPVGKARVGTVGPPIPGCEVKFDEDGELLARGQNIFMGYFKSAKDTKAVMTDDNFFRTGDIGEFDSEGYIRITDRKKDLIITAGGKNIAPQVIEGKLKQAALVSQAVVIGDKRPYVSALITLDPEVAEKWSKDQGINGDITELPDNPKVQETIAKVVEDVNKTLAQVEQIKKWTILPRDFTQEAEEITPTMKVKRKTINEKYADKIERMYA